MSCQFDEFLVKKKLVKMKESKQMFKMSHVNLTNFSFHFRNHGI